MYGAGAAGFLDGDEPEELQEAGVQLARVAEYYLEYEESLAFCFAGLAGGPGLGAQALVVERCCIALSRIFLRRFCPFNYFKPLHLYACLMYIVLIRFNKHFNTILLLCITRVSLGLF